MYAGLSFFMLKSFIFTVSAIIPVLHDKGVYEDFIVGKYKVHVSVLQFVDNTLLFCHDGMLDSLVKTIV